MSVKIISDSSSDMLNIREVEFSSVPLKIITDEKEYIDDAELDVGGMIADLKKYKGTSKSSCPNIEDWKNAMQGADKVICVTITSNLSGSNNTANLALGEYLSEQEGREGFVIDTLSTGPENALIIEKLCSLINSGLSITEIKQQIDEYKAKTHLIFSLESLRNLANNGRVNGAVAKLAGILGIRVVGKASNEGTLEISHKVRGGEKALATVFKKMNELGFNGGRVRIHHCKNRQAATALQNMIAAQFNKAEVFVQETRALCSFYAEEGGLLVGFEGAVK